MNKALGFSLAVLIAFVTSGLANPAWAKDKVKILSVVPDSVTVVPFGGESEIVVEVEYKLESKDEGEIALGFNTKHPSSFRMRDKVVVKRGSGKVALRAKVKPVDWESESPFYAHVNISEYPHAETWSPLASAMKKIKVIRQ